MKVIKSLENREILVKENTRKITSQEGGFFKFLRPLMTVGVLLINRVLIPLDEDVLLLFTLSAGMPATDVAI